MPSKSAPSYLRHASGQAFSRVNGKNVYFGIHRSPESLARYDDFKREWLLQQGDVHRPLPAMKAIWPTVAVSSRRSCCVSHPSAPAITVRSASIPPVNRTKNAASSTR